jgi:hypothetical protein
MRGGNAMPSRTVIASAAKQSISRLAAAWIASSQALLAMTVDTVLPSRGTIRPRFSISFRDPPIQRAQGMPDARCTRGLMRKCAQEVRARAYRAAENIRHSLRNGFTAYFELSPVTGSFATVACAHSSHWTPCDIAKLDASTGASGPHDFTVRSHAVRFRHCQRPPRPVSRSWRS